MTPRVLALDLATQCGWALMANGVLTSGSAGFQRYAGSKSRPAEHRGQPYLNFQRWLRERIQTDKPEVIVYEDVYRWSSGDAAKAYGAFRGTLMVNCAYYGLPVVGYAPGQIKKHFTGNGGAKKPLMMAVARKRWPDLPGDVDDNQCDALAILDLHLSQKG